MKLVYVIVGGLIAIVAGSSTGEEMDELTAIHMCLPVRMTSNQVSTINAELGDQSLRAAAVKAAGLDQRQATLAQNFRVKGRNSFLAFDNGITFDKFEVLSVRMFWYAASRAQGHSREYSIAGLTERGTNLFLYPATPKEVVLRQQPDIPPSWLRPVAGLSNTFFLVDNGLAYGYRPLAIADDGGTNYCPYAQYGGMSVCDANELDPKKAPLITQASTEANATLEKRGLKRGELGACHEHWEEMKRILKEKYQIDWKSPAEVNPSIIFD